MTLILSPRSRVGIQNWTLGDGGEPAIYNRRPYYVVYINNGNTQQESTLGIGLKVSKEGFSCCC